MTFALDHHHLKNHRALLQRDFALYTQEVQIVLHPEWKDLYESFNESLSAWLDNLASNVRHMSPRTLEVYTLLVADLWNESIVRPGEVAQLLGMALDVLLWSTAATDTVFRALSFIR